MHATIEQLLAIRDREPVAAGLKQHVDTCLLCRERLDKFILARNELNRLPGQSPRRNYWPDILARHERGRQSRNYRRKLARYSGFGLAASTLLVSVLFIYQTNDADNGTVVLDSTAAPAKSVAEDNVPPDDQLASIAKSVEPELNTLIARSARLEAALHALPQRPHVARASTSDLITGLQDGVALIDYQLNFTAGNLPAQTSRQLWQQRVDLMNSLVNVRYAEAQQVAYTTN
ncbi:MAG: hypothetical protein HW386_1459 [Gammaproteobacteria bacterium]|nr:hypothetical protein [Gammaproteobacteria bacterium]